MRVAKFYVLLFVPLFGCATPQETPPREAPRAPVFKAVELQVAVREKCVVELPREPEWALDTIGDPRTADPADLVGAAVREIEQRRDWINKAKVAAIKCE